MPPNTAPTLPDDAEIARRATLLPIEDIAARAGLPEAALNRYGRFMAKVDLDVMADLPDRRAKLILVTAISPTPAGEGKTTTTIGLGDALNRSGRRTIICLREPSLGPCFGLKGGATGGGHSQVVPMDKINLHFTGDFHALGAANNLLAAMIDNHIYWGNHLGLDPGRVSWRRALDMNDRALRDIVIGLGGHGPVRQAGFDITVASETMAAFCLASSPHDLEARLGRMIVGRTFERRNVTARELKAGGAMAALLRDALQPNLVQTLDRSPALVHGGPFANIAHGCNSVLATDMALRLADYVVTEAGFGADLGAEKFCDIKCRSASLAPAVCVVVATVRALKMHGGVPRSDLSVHNVGAVRAGLANLIRHVENMRKFGAPVTVAINHFAGDAADEIDAVEDACASLGVTAHLCRHWAEGGAGALALANEVAGLTAGTAGTAGTTGAAGTTGTAGAAGPEGVGGGFRMLYEDSLPLADKIRTVACEIYRARAVVFSPAALRQLAEIEQDGFGHLPVCMAKTQYSFSSDPNALGAPTGFDLPVRELRLSAGAGFVVAICGDIMTMPGLPRSPAAERIRIGEDGTVHGLF